MFNNSETKLNKIITAIFAISALISLVFQVIGILSFTKTKLGKRIRKGVVSSVYDYMDESVDQACERMPQWMSKIESIDQ